MKTLLIVYHTMTDGARQMAAAAARGAAGEPQVRVRLTPARETTADDVLQAQGYIFVTPENLASMSGIMKDFFDRTFYAVLDQITGRAYATLICAGSDGENAVRQIDRICTGWRLRKAAEPVIVCTHAQTPEKILAQKVIPSDQLQRCEDVGAALAAGLALGVF
jgi:NAD(P)H-dependent FMN reductase